MTAEHSKIIMGKLIEEIKYSSGENTYYVFESCNEQQGELPAGVEVNIQSNDGAAIVKKKIKKAIDSTQPQSSDNHLPTD